MNISNTKLNKLNQIAEGGEGIIYEYNKDILKVYKNTVDIVVKERKVINLINKRLPKEIISPKEAVYNNGKFIGYIMPKVQGNELRMYINKKFIKTNNITTKDILEILSKIKDTVDYLHKNNIFIGDLNDQNILVDFSNNVYFIDCDSWSIDDDKCEVIMDLFKDPLMHSNDFDEKTDTYALSIIIWKMLTRIHPYGGTMNPDMDILERMKKGISVIDNPKIKIPRTIKSWNYLSPSLVQSLKSIFDNKSRELNDELSDMVNNLKYCNIDHEYYYGKFNQCPLCNANAKVIMKPVLNGVVNGLKLYTLLVEDRIKIVLNSSLYINQNDMVSDLDNNEYEKYQRGIKYYFLNIDNNRVLVRDKDAFFEFTINNRDYSIPKRYKSAICVENNEIYYITNANKFSKLTITPNGNGLQNITSCSYESYFSSENGIFCIVNKYDKKLIININGKNIEYPYNNKIVNYGLHYDRITKKWLIIFENTQGKFDTLIASDTVEYTNDKIKYQGSLNNTCFSNNIIFMPIDDKIRGYNYIKQAFKDFECNVVSSDSKLIKLDSAFVIINDENIYKLGNK